MVASPALWVTHRVLISRYACLEPATRTSRAQRVPARHACATNVASAAEPRIVSELLCVSQYAGRHGARHPGEQRRREPGPARAQAHQRQPHLLAVRARRNATLSAFASERGDVFPRRRFSARSKAAHRLLSDLLPPSESFSELFNEPVSSSQT